MKDNQKVGAVIVAAGNSQRMNGVDKIFAPLGGKPVLARVVEVFQNCEAIDQVVVVLSQQNLDAGKDLIAKQNLGKVTDVVPGGDRRQDSVLAGLNKLVGCQWVVIHDGARPFVTPELIKEGLEAAGETGAAIAAVPVTDTIKMAGPDLTIQGTPPRASLWSAQTPQVFRFDTITEAYRQNKYDVTDDARLVEQMGKKVKLYIGSYDNIKITNPNDLAFAEILLSKK